MKYSNKLEMVDAIKNNEIRFDDYVWECTNPEIGG